MKKFLLVLAAAALIPASVSACTYENIKLENGTVKARWIPCNDESCPNYREHFQRLKNKNVVYEHDVSKDEKKPAEGNAGNVYDKNQHRERDVNSINAENDAINAAIKKAGEIPEQQKKENR